MDPKQQAREQRAREDRLYVKVREKAGRMHPQGLDSLGMPERTALQALCLVLQEELNEIRERFAGPEDETGCWEDPQGLPPLTFEENRP